MNYSELFSEENVSGVPYLFLPPLFLSVWTHGYVSYWATIYFCAIWLVHPAPRLAMGNRFEAGSWV